MCIQLALYGNLLKLLRCTREREHFLNAVHDVYPIHEQRKTLRLMGNEHDVVDYRSENWME